jgi:hypothetical protein
MRSLTKKMKSHNKMRTTLLTFLTFTLTLSCYGLDRDYVPRAILTKDQEKEVIALAKKCGMKEISKISTHNMYPSPFRGIQLQGPEKIKGREISYQGLSMSHSEWLEPGAKPRKGQIQMGKFWAGKPYTQKKIILKVGKKDFHIRSINGMMPEECETILGLLLSGKYEIGAAVNKKTLEQVGWNTPSNFSKRGEYISVGFLHKAKDSGFFDLQIKMVGKKITIEQMFQAIP